VIALRAFFTFNVARTREAVGSRCAGRARCSVFALIATAFLDDQLTWFALRERTFDSRAISFIFVFDAQSIATAAIIIFAVIALRAFFTFNVARTREAVGSRCAGWARLVVFARVATACFHQLLTWFALRERTSDSRTITFARGTTSTRRLHKMSPVRTRVNRGAIDVVARVRRARAALTVDLSPRRTIAAQIIGARLRRTFRWACATVISDLLSRRSIRT